MLSHPKQNTIVSTGRIVYTIPASEALETPWSDFVIIETLPKEERTSTQEPDAKSEPDLTMKAEDNTEEILAHSIFAIPFAIIAAGVCMWWHCVRDKGKDSNNSQQNQF